MTEITINTAAGDLAYQRWGPGANQYFHLKKHAIPDEGGNPICIMLHGSPPDNDARLPFVNNANLNHLANHILDRTALTDRHFHIVSVMTEQALYGTNLGGGTHSQNGTVFRDNFRSGSCYYPELIDQVRQAIVGIKRYMAETGLGNPDLCVLAGVSYGAWRAMLSQIVGPLREGTELAFGEARDITDFSTAKSARGLPGNDTLEPVYDSRVSALLNWQGQPDLRRSPHYTGGNDVLPGTLIRNYFPGVFSNDEFDANVPNRILEEASVLWYLEQGRTRWWCPTLSIYPTEAHSFPLTSGHEPIQGAQLEYAIRAAHSQGDNALEHKIGTQIASGGSWGDTQSIEAYGWFNSHLPRQQHQHSA